MSVLQFPIPFIIVALLVRLPPNGNSDRGSHSRLFAFLPTTVRALHFYLKKDSAFSSLVDSRRIVPTVQYPRKIGRSRPSVSIEKQKTPYGDSMTSNLLRAVFEVNH